MTDHPLWRRMHLSTAHARLANCSRSMAPAPAANECMQSDGGMLQQASTCLPLKGHLPVSERIRSLRDASFFVPTESAPNKRYFYWLNFVQPFCTAYPCY